MVLADDPHTVEQEKIKDIQIVRTVVGGADGLSGVKPRPFGPCAGREAYADFTSRRLRAEGRGSPLPYFSIWRVFML